MADDATAASWNPGGLIQLERPEFSVVGEAFSRREDLHFADFPKVSGDQQVSDGGVNYVSLVYPFKFEGQNMVHPLELPAPL